MIEMIRKILLSSQAEKLIKINYTSKNFFVKEYISKNEYNLVKKS